MKFLIIITTLLVCTHAAPKGELNHPSPVNPDVLVAIKPEEKITLITDPKELVKFKRETKHPFYPTVLPKQNEKRITKRDHSSVVTVSNDKNETNKHSENDHIVSTKEKDNKSKYISSEGFLKPKESSTISLHGHKKRDIPVPLNAKQNHSEESPKESIEKESQEDGKEQQPKSQLLPIKKGFQKIPSLPLVLKETIPTLDQHKRDIPVPLVPKHHHPEETPKDSNEKTAIETNKTESQKIHQTYLNEQENEYKVEQQRQQFAGEALKEIRDESNKEVKSEYHDSQVNYVSKIQPSQSDEHVSTEGKGKQHDSTYQGQHGIHRHKESQKELNSHEKESNKNIEEHLNKHDVDDISKTESSQRGSSSGSNSSTPTTEHPLLRRRPVPVTELFSRAIGN